MLQLLTSEFPYLQHWITAFARPYYQGPCAYSHLINFLNIYHHY